VLKEYTSPIKTYNRREKKLSGFLKRNTRPFDFVAGNSWFCGREV